MCKKLTFLVSLLFVLGSAQLGTDSANATQYIGLMDDVARICSFPV